MSFRASLFAMTYDRQIARSEEAGLHAMRQRLLADAAGEVLEIGAGTGANIGCYGPEVKSLTVTEPLVPMVRRLEGRVRDQGAAATVLRAPAEDLPFDDDAFDVAVSTLVLCGVDDQPRALREVRRVLRPGGRLLFLEHVRSDDPALARLAGQAELAQPDRGHVRLQPAHARHDQAGRLHRRLARTHHAAKGSEVRRPGHHGRRDQAA